MERIFIFDSLRRSALRPNRQRDYICFKVIWSSIISSAWRTTGKVSDKFPAGLGESPEFYKKVKQVIGSAILKNVT